MIEDQRQMNWCRWSEGGGTSDRLEEEVEYCDYEVGCRLVDGIRERVHVGTVCFDCEVCWRFVVVV